MLDAVQQARCISAKEAKELKERLLAYYDIHRRIHVF